MGIPLKTTMQRTARGKTRKVISNLIPGPPFLFEITYDRTLHHRVVLDHIRTLVKPQGRRYDLRRARIAKPWHEAILRDAPMLKGFFADEPKWRDKLLRWCEAVLAGE
jgi:hypothetical protein